MCGWKKNSRVGRRGAIFQFDRSSSGALKKGSLFKRNACTNIIFARLINDRRAGINVLVSWPRDHLAATKFNQAFHYARHSPFDRWHPKTSKVICDPSMRSMNRFGRIDPYVSLRIKCEFELDGIIENFPRDRKEN